MPNTIEMVMLTIAALIIIFCKPNVESIVSGNVFKAGATAVVAIFGIAWMGDTFFNGNLNMIQGSIQHLVTSAPWLFAIALFILSILLYSQAATVRALMPLGLSLGIPPALLIAMFPAVNGYFFIPNYGTIVAAINFDRTGTTGIGKYVLNHSFMIPGLIATFTSIGIGMLLISIMFKKSTNLYLKRFVLLIKCLFKFWGSLFLHVALKILHVLPYKLLLLLQLIFSYFHTQIQLN